MQKIFIMSPLFQRKRVSKRNGLFNRVRRQNNYLNYVKIIRMKKVKSKKKCSDC